MPASPPLSLSKNYSQKAFSLRYSQVSPASPYLCKHRVVVRPGGSRSVALPMKVLCVCSSHRAQSCQPHVAQGTLLRQLNTKTDCWGRHYLLLTFCFDWSGI